jgi:hypothetical protein
LLLPLPALSSGIFLLQATQIKPAASIKTEYESQPTDKLSANESFRFPPVSTLKPVRNGGLFVFISLEKMDFWV